MVNTRPTTVYVFFMSDGWAHPSSLCRQLIAKIFQHSDAPALSLESSTQHLITFNAHMLNHLGRPDQVALVTKIRNRTFSLESAIANKFTRTTQNITCAGFPETRQIWHSCHVVFWRVLSCHYEQDSALQPLLKVCIILPSWDHWRSLSDSCFISEDNRIITT